MFSKKNAILAMALFATFMRAGFAQAASDDECANYLCLPAGFATSECSDPKEAMKDRLKDGKSPLPGFSSCFSDSDSTSPLRTTFGNATRGYYHNKLQFFKNTKCRMRKGEYIPDGCGGRNYWYVELYDDSGNPYPIMDDGAGLTVGNTRYIRK